MRTIKKYSNRKLYDPTAHRYVRLPQLSELVRGGEDIEVKDQVTGADVTAEVLAQAIHSEERSSRTYPVSTLVGVIRGVVPSELPAGARDPLPCDCWEGVNDREGMRPCEHQRLPADAGPFECSTSPGTCRCGAVGPPWEHSDGCEYD